MPGNSSSAGVSASAGSGAAASTSNGSDTSSGWDGPVLTDSGGYQVFSLAHMCEVTDDCVRFRSHIDGLEIELSPERGIEIQHMLGADVIMQLDECPPAGAPKEQVGAAVERSAAWAEACLRKWCELDRKSAQGSAQALFGIQQGGTFPDLREQSARMLTAMDLPGYAIGGLSVGEGHEAMCEVLDTIDEQLPRDKPRYLMGVGEPRDMIEAVRRGVDMFDCVMPTRNARNAQAFTRTGRIRLRNTAHRLDTSPIDPECDCYTCRNFSRGTLRHLFIAKEMLGPILVTIHNVRFFADLMRRMRCAIEIDEFDAQSRQWVEDFYKNKKGS